MKLIKKILFINFFLYIKIANNYYQKHKEKLQKESRKRYQNLSEEETEKRRNKNLSEKKKKKVIEYRRNYYLVHNK